MNTDVFKKQIDRLRETYSDRYYPKPRIEQIWAVTKRETDGTFERAINWLIQTHRSPPLVPEILKAIERIKAEDKQRARESSGSADIYSQLQSASKRTTADPDFVKACLKLLRERLDGKLNHKQFIEGCDLLDEAARSLR